MPGKESSPDVASDCAVCVLSSMRSSYSIALSPWPCTSDTTVHRCSETYVQNKATHRSRMAYLSSRGHMGLVWQCSSMRKSACEVCDLLLCGCQGSSSPLLVGSQLKHLSSSSAYSICTKCQPAQDSSAVLPSRSVYNMEAACASEYDPSGKGAKDKHKPAAYCSRCCR